MSLLTLLALALFCGNVAYFFKCVFCPPKLDEEKFRLTIISYIATPAFLLVSILVSTLFYSKPLDIDFCILWSCSTIGVFAPKIVSQEKLGPLQQFRKWWMIQKKRKGTKYNFYTVGFPFLNFLLSNLLFLGVIALSDPPFALILGGMTFFEICENVGAVPEFIRRFPRLGSVVGLAIAVGVNFLSALVIRSMSGHLAYGLQLLSFFLVGFFLTSLMKGWKK
ncbi:MAG: hypothetical protein QW356_08165 [Candidatus Hadarchaeales archaeon]